jgi:RNase P subunit RPR2
MSRVPLLIAAVLGAPLIFWASRSPRPAEADDPPAEAAEQLDPIWANAACYVCHTLFVKEELSRVHLEDKVTCIKCHGLSAAHANDENVGATLPDVVFKRRQVDAMCVECHETHDAPAREVVVRFVERRLSPKSPPTCTDCHGRHKIEPPADNEHT